MSRASRYRRARLRVCHLAYTFYENDNRVIRYAEAMASAGDDVDVIALRRSGQSRQRIGTARFACTAFSDAPVTEKRELE